MKNLIKSLLALTFLGIVASGCGSKDDPDPTEKIQLKKLVKTWNISTAKLDGSLREDFSTISLVITGTFDKNRPEGPYNYSVSGTRPNPSPWPASGSWTFGAGEAAKSIITRDSGTNSVDMTYTLSSDGNTLTLNFNVSGGGWAGSTARTQAVNGDWEFVFTAD